jgi:hypothetical protein
MKVDIKTRLLGVALAGMLLSVAAFAPGLGPCAWAGSKSLARSKVVYTGETPVYPGYPRAFDCVGRIDRITASEVVIDDSRYRISSSAAYHTPRQLNALPSEIHVGDMVGCLNDSDGMIESIWIINRKP